MSAHDNGGPAFPVHDVQAAEPETVLELKSLARGMTLRDYFAAKAMQGLCASFANVAAEKTEGFASGMPAVAYEMADAMLAARKEGGAA